jgi:hypothetical protein
MTAPTGPAGPDPAPPQAGTPGGDVPENAVDVRYLAGQRLPAAGTWLKVTTAEPGPGGEFTAVFLPDDQAHAHGGDVLLHVFPAAGGTGQAVPDAQVRVVTVVAGSLVLVAAWDRLDLDLWPGQVHPAAAFARGVLGELRDHGADLGGPVQIAVQAASPVAGFPFLESKHPVMP